MVLPMEEERPKLRMPATHLRETVIEIEKHTGSVTGPLPKTHDDYAGVLHLAKRHHPEHHKG